MSLVCPLAAYTRRPSGETATTTGFASPSSSVAVASTRRRRASLIDTVPPIPAVTYARAPSGAKATARGHASTVNAAATARRRDAAVERPAALGAPEVAR